MPRFKPSLIFLCLLLCYLSGQSFAAENKRTLTAVSKAPSASDVKVALVIGNSRYRDMPLKNPGNDARAMAAKLRLLGFQVVLKEDLGAMQIGAALREFRSRLSPGAVAIFYYAGHGLQVKGVNYLPAVDAQIESEEDVPRGSLNVNEVLGLMDEAKTRLNLVFLDACRNNPYARSFRSTGGGLAKLDAPSGTLISFATRPGSVAADGGGNNGIYTEQLLKAMDRPGLQVEQVLKQVTSQVKRASGGKQEPWMEGSIEGDFYFREPSGGLQQSAPPVIPSAPALRVNSPEEIEQEYWNRIRESRIVSDYEAYLAEYPKGRFAVIARTEINRIRLAENEKNELIIKQVITDYYNHRSEWQGVFYISGIEKLRILPRPGITEVHVRYRYSPVPGNRLNRKDSGYDQRIFILDTSNGIKVAEMKGNMSASF